MNICTKNLLNNKLISRNLKVQLYKTVVTKIVLFGNEIRIIRQSDQKMADI